MDLLNRARLWIGLLAFGCLATCALAVSAQTPYSSSRTGSSVASGPISNRINNRIDSRTSTTRGTVNKRVDASRGYDQKAQSQPTSQTGAAAAKPYATGAIQGNEKAKQSELPPAAPLPKSLPGSQPLGSRGSYAPYTIPGPGGTAGKATSAGTGVMPVLAPVGSDLQGLYSAGHEETSPKTGAQSKEAEK